MGQISSEFRIKVAALETENKSRIDIMLQQTIRIQDLKDEIKRLREEIAVWIDEVGEISDEALKQHMKAVLK